MVNIQHFWESEISTWGDDSSVTDDEVDEVDEIQRTGPPHPTRRSSNYQAGHQADPQISTALPPPEYSSPVVSEVTMLQRKEADLYSRDFESIEYTKSLLQEGDTLVFIKYPGDINVYDTTGIHLKPQTHRVHSEKLLATGSEKFAKLLSDDWKQHLMRKRNGYVNKEALPTGITYVLDLTPPDEGDEAVDLISDLSCSAGIRNWHSSMKRCGVHKRLVGGKDDVCRQKNLSAPTLDPKVPKPDVETASPLVGNNNSDILDSSVSAPAQYPHARVFLTNETYESEVKELETALERSREEQRQRESLAFQFKQDDNDTTVASEVVEEYCPIRHRAGIQGLLQVIEGKDPKLDSAPKLWTLVGVAKYFGCTTIVVDFIVSWMLAEPNTQFLETLPEASFTIGKTLQIPIITRPAFAILVAEEALSLAGRMNKRVVTNWSTHSRPQPRDKSISCLGRPMEDIDEDSLTAVQAAATDFQSRIQKAVEDLVDPEMKWLDALPEFAKLSRFLSDKSIDITFEIALERLVSDLRAYVRAEILSIFAMPLPDDLSIEANAHRRAEQYQGEWKQDFGDTYSKLVDNEKIMTRFYWRMLLNLPWRADNDISYLFGVWHGPRNFDRESVIERYRVPPVTVKLLNKYEREVNHFIAQSDLEIFTGSRHYDHPGKRSAPGSIFRNRPRPDPLSEFSEYLASLEKSSRNAEEAEKPEEKIEEKIEAPESPVLGSIADWKLPLRPRPVDPQQNLEPKRYEPSKVDEVAISPKYPQPNTFSDRWTWLEPPAGSNLAPTFCPPSLGEHVPGSDKSYNTRFFSLRLFMKEVSTHICCLSTNMLSDSEVDFRSLTDTLLCLTHDEYKYLPLWAGGDDDGTGGVFDASLPPASMGPIGPGPSYHTGFSVNSRASTEMDWEGDSVDTSIAVENGFSEHIDRRVVQSDDGIESSTAGSVAFSYDSEDYNDAKDKGKGKAVVKNTQLMSKGKGVKRDEVEDEDMIDEDDDFESFSDDESWVDDDGQI